MSSEGSFESVNDYWTFEQVVRMKYRSGLDGQVGQFIETVGEVAKRRTRQLGKGAAICRAQSGCIDVGVLAETDVEAKIVDAVAPYRADRMLPQRHVAKENRANPKGIPFVYAASREQVAMARSEFRGRAFFLGNDDRLIAKNGPL